MQSIVVSIPHTGTKFLQKRMNIKHQIHSHAPWKEIVKAVEGKKICVPLRHPFKVWDSWARRNNPKRPFPYITWGFAWYAMHMIDTLYDVEFIDLEAQRDLRISDWSPEGHFEDKGYYAAPIPCDINKLFKLPFVERHYEFSKP